MSGIADAQENGFVLRARLRKRLVVPREPVHGIVRVLEQIRRFLARQTIGVSDIHLNKIEGGGVCRK